MKQETKIFILIGAIIMIAIILYFILFKQNSGMTEITQAPIVPIDRGLMVDGYTREDYARMGYSNDDINLLFS